MRTRLRGRVRVRIRARRRGIALPMALLVLVALGMLSALALSDALQAARVATLAEDEALAQAASLEGLARLTEPDELHWLCLQPPMHPVVLSVTGADGRRLEIRWWMVAPGVVRAELVGVGAAGAKHRRIAWMRPDSLEAVPGQPGCPAARRLVPIGPEWLGAHPEG